MLLYETREVSVNICLFEALRYKEEGRAFDSRWGREFFIDWIFPGDSASNSNQSNINSYQEYLLKGRGSQCVGLTTLPLSCAVCPKVLGNSTS
jgi:hypothetical protein